MSNQIPTHRVQQYSANVYHLVQQKGSKLKGLVRHETMKSKRMFFDAIGTVDAVEKTGRHSQTPQMDTPHSRRALTMKHYHWGDLIDDQDKIQMLHDPKSYYAQAAAFAFGRKMDDVIVGAIHGTSYSGEEGSTAVTMPNTRKIASVASTAFSNMNLDTLRLAKYYFDKEDVEGTLNMAVGAKQVYGMLGEEELTNSDYAAIKALVKGDISSFMGFNFIMTNRLPIVNASTLSSVSGVDDVTDAAKFSTTTGEYDNSTSAVTDARMCLAWVKENIILGTGMGVETKVSERNDLSHSTQVYVRMSIGATRLEEEKALLIYCTEA